MRPVDIHSHPFAAQIKQATLNLETVPEDMNGSIDCDLDSVNCFSVVMNDTGLCIQNLLPVHEAHIPLEDIECFYRSDLAGSGLFVHVKSIRGYSRKD